MQTIDELAWLVRSSLRLWRRHLPVLIAWLAAGWAVREFCFHAAVLFGPNRVAAMVCFALGMVVWVVCIVGMLHTATQQPRAFELIGRVTDGPRIPRRRWRDVMVEAIVPFLAVYAVWGLTEEQVQRAFTANLTYWGLDAANFSISFADWRLYLVVTVVAWALQAGISHLTPSRGKGLLTSGVLTFLRGVAILTAFLGLDTLWATVLTWLRGRQVWMWGRNAWDGFVDVLPRWDLPLGLATLPEVVQEVGVLIWSGLLPGLVGAVLVPLLWLALTAMGVGWHDFTSRAADGRLARLLGSATSRARLTAERAATSKDVTPWGLVRRFVAGQLEPVLPVVEAFRLILRAGLPLLGAYLVLAAAVRALSTWLDDALLWLIGPNSPATTVRYASLTELAAELVAWPLAVCLYASAFDRTLLLTLGELQEDRAKPIPTGSST